MATRKMQSTPGQKTLFTVTTDKMAISLSVCKVTSGLRVLTGKADS